MILLLAPAAAWASDALSDADRGGCIYANSAAHGPTPDTDNGAAPHPPAHKPGTPATTTGGGSDGDVPLPRMRIPRWHSFLPGMFR